MKAVTEETNSNTKDIDRRPTREIVGLINREDKTVAEAVAECSIGSPMRLTLLFSGSHPKAGCSTLEPERADGWVCWMLPNVRRRSSLAGFGSGALLPGATTHCIGRLKPRRMILNRRSVISLPLASQRAM
jgi:hypothetical protein